MNDALGCPTRSAALEISHTWFQSSDLTQTAVCALGVLFFVGFFLPLLSVNVVLDEGVQNLLLVHVLGPQWHNIRNIIIRLEHAPLNERSWVNIFRIENNKFLLLIPVLLEHFKLGLEVILIIWLIRGKVPLRVKRDRFCVLEVLFLRLGGFLRGGLGFFVGGFGL